nr:hypothetical protein Iba_chr13dCG1200 [Ipomoea batatas]
MVLVGLLFISATKLAGSPRDALGRRQRFFLQPLPQEESQAFSILPLTSPPILSPFFDVNPAVNYAALGEMINGIGKIGCEFYGMKGLSLTSVSDCCGLLGNIPMKASCVFLYAHLLCWSLGLVVILICWEVCPQTSALPTGRLYVVAGLKLVEPDEYQWNRDPGEFILMACKGYCFNSMKDTTVLMWPFINLGEMVFLKWNRYFIDFINGLPTTWLPLQGVPIRWLLVFGQISDNLGVGADGYGPEFGLVAVDQWSNNSCQDARTPSYHLFFGK